jgi:hypothetical protein
MVSFAHQHIFFGQQVFRLKPCHVLGGIRATQFDYLHHLISHQLQECPLLLVEFPGLVVQHAQYPRESLPGVSTRRPRKIADVDHQGNKDIVAEAIIEGGVGYLD